MHHYHYELREIPADALVLKRGVVERHSIRIGHDRKYHIPKASFTTVLQSSINVMKRIWNALPNEILLQQTRLPSSDLSRSSKLMLPWPDQWKPYEGKN
uniref:Uncharacterized protein n=1 Tax=Acrobeloides nanus TaxID=290746 RepID=A0A914CIA1_9BILA